MNPYIVINFFLFFFIRNIYRLPSVENPIPLIFNSSLMLGLASLYFLNIILLTIIIWLGLLLHRTNSWRNFMASIIGVIIPYLFILTWYYWSDQLQDYFLILSERSFFTFNTIISIDIPDLIISVVISFFIVLGVLKTFVSLGEKNINLRRNLIITIYFLIFIVIIFILFATGLNAALLIVVPASLILSNAFHNLRNYKIYNIVFVVLFTLIIFNQYLKFFYNF